MARPTEIAGKAMGKMKGMRQALTGGAGIFERLATEHGEVGTMLRRVALTGERSDARDELYEKIRTELRAHATAEEKKVYSRFRQIPELAEKMGHAADEHHEIETYLSKLDEMEPDDDQWIHLFREMAMKVQHHVVEEELRIFPIAKKALSKEEAEELESIYLDAKEALGGET
jgi:hemerythrin superfamily protein